MKKIADFICKNKIGILIITCILFVLSVIGYFATGVNYDILVYLPKDIETVEGQDILTDEFGIGAYTVVLTQNLNSKEIINLQNEYKKIDGVSKVISAYDLTGSAIPIEMLPSEIVNKIHDAESDVLFVTFTDSTSADSTIKALKQMREVSQNKAKISGMSSMVLDTMNLSEKEITIYIIIAVILCIIVLELSLDSYVVPILLLVNLGIAIVFNLGSNIIFGEISYITKALVAVLQLGVTTDFSIFLYHAYEEEKKKKQNSSEAMSMAIVKTFKSVLGSSSTTIVGFLVLCAMELTLGKDLGLVMAKGVFLGVICVLTVFPSMILFFDKLIDKWAHRSLAINFKGLNSLVIKHHKIIFIIFVLLLVPAYLAYSKVEVYYKIDRSLPDTLESIVANKELSEKFNIVSPQIILLPSDMKLNEEENLIEELEALDGIDFVISSASLAKLGITSNMLPESLSKVLESDNYKLVMFNSLYEVASDELNEQIDEVNVILNKYDENSILAGEGALTKDLITISDKDFKNVNTASIGLILIVMLIVLKSISLPILLVIAIEFAIFMNMGISYLGGTVLPFVAPIVLGTIQLGATIDYAILLTTTYVTHREKGLDKKEAMLKATNYSAHAIFVSSLCFFAATFGVGVYSKLEMVSSLCMLISRGAILSMMVAILVLPSILLVFDKLIFKTTLKGKEIKKMKKMRKSVLLSLAIMLLVSPISALALTKEETVYGKLNADGSVKKIIVNEHLINDEDLDKMEDYSDLKDIINLSGEEKYTRKDNDLTWDAKKKDILYQGTSDKELPISEKITYKLNGEDISLKDLLGKEGKVEITIKYTNNDSHDYYGNTLYTPFVITTALVLPGDINEKIRIEGGKAIDNGDKYIVIGLSSPGLYESLGIANFKDFDTVKVSYTTKKFSLPSIYSVVSSKLLDDTDLSVFNKLDSIGGSIGTLQTSMNQIETGSKEILTNLETINYGSAKIYENLNLVVGSINQIKAGTMTLNQGFNEVVPLLEEAIQEFSSAEGQAKLNGLNQVYQLDVAQKATLESNMTALATAYQTGIGGQSLASYSYDALYTMSPDLFAVKFRYENMALENTQLLSLLDANISALEGSLAIVSKLQGLLQNAEKIKEAAEGITTLSSGLDTLYLGTSELTSKMGELSYGTNELTSGMKTLDAGISKFNKEGIGSLSMMASSITGSSSRIKTLVNLGNSYKTYSLSRDEDNATTKFILVVDSVKAK